MVITDKQKNRGPHDKTACGPYGISNSDSVNEFTDAKEEKKVTEREILY
jgi:hypothetical protein